MLWPIAFGPGIEFNGSHLSHGDVGRDFGPARRWRYPAAVGPGHDEFVAMNVNRMTRHREIAHPDSHPVVQSHDHRIDSRKHAAIEVEQVEFEHRADFWGEAARIDVVVVEQEHEVA